MNTRRWTLPAAIVFLVGGVAVMLRVHGPDSGDIAPSATATAAAESPAAATQHRTVKQVKSHGTENVLDPEGAAAKAPTPTQHLEGRLAQLLAALQRAQQRSEQRSQRRTHAQVQSDSTASPWTVTKDGIQGAVQSSIPDIRECYEAWLGLNPTMGGKVVVAFRIEVDEHDASVGRVVKAALKGEGLGNQFMDGCILASLASLQFEAPTHEGGIDVTYPFSFASADVQGP